MFKGSKKEDKFYEHFNANAAVIHESAVMLKTYMDNLEDAEQGLKQIKDKEREGDQQVHDILNELNHTFITPFDREDIYAIAKEMDNIIDYIETTASRFVLFNVKEATKEAKQLTALIEKSTKELIILMENLKYMNKTSVVTEKIIEINRIEEEGDLLSRQALRNLFTSELPVLEIIKWREIYDHLENTLDACEDVANLIEGVVTKNA